MTTSRRRVVLEADLLEGAAELQRRAVEDRDLAVHLDQQVGDAGGMQRRQQVLDGGDRRFVVSLERRGVGRLAHRRDVRRDARVRRQGDEVNAVVGR
jgi:hypothetical protein